MKAVLLISYYFEPFNGVGAKRLSYWAKAFFESPQAYICTVITATEQPACDPRIHYVKDNAESITNKLAFGVSWISPVRRHLDSIRESFDCVIISGGPFGHFPLTKYFKQKYKCKVILDFRDPFSGNVRFKSSRLAEFVKRRFEKHVSKHTDHILTVNECCRKLLVKNLPDKRVSVIENGYDESIVDKIVSKKKNDGKTHIVHAGRLYANIMPFAEALITWNRAHSEKQYIFHHLGQEISELSDMRSDFIVQHGQKSYSETIEIMKKCSVGFLLTRGGLLEYNTKIFDYIGCHLDTLIVTFGQKESGCIHGLTQRLGESVFWSTVSLKDIHNFFRQYVPGKPGKFAREDYSRRAGFRKLTEILNSSDDGIE